MTTRVNQKGRDLKQQNKTCNFKKHDGKIHPSNYETENTLSIFSKIERRLRPRGDFRLC